MNRNRWGLALAAAFIGLGACRTADQLGPAAERVDQRAEAARLLRSSSRHAPTPVFIDGRRFSQSDEPEGYSVIDPDRIATIQLLKGDEGEAKAGAAGRAGVIWITTKDAAPAR